MPSLIILYWRDIPAQVIAKAGRTTARRELPKRFIEAIDRCAMRSKATGTQDYLEEWRRGEAQPCGDDLEAAVDAAAATLEAGFDASRLDALVNAQGRAG